MPTPRDKPTHIVAKAISYAVLGLVCLVALIVFFGSWYIIGSGERGVLLHWGRADTVSVEPGLHFKMPIRDDVVKFDVRTQKYGADASADSYESAASKDLQIVKANIAVNYHINPDSVSTIYSTVGPNYEDVVITPAIHDAMKATTAQYTAEELVTKREEVRDEISKILSEKLRPYNIVVESVNIVKFDFSEGFNAAIEAKVTAEQQKEKAVNDLERIKVEAQQQVATAQGQRDAAIAQATGEAEKVKLVQEQLRQSPQYIEYIKAQKWDGKLPWFTGNGATPIVDMRNLASFSVVTNGNSTT